MVTDSVSCTNMWVMKSWRKDGRLYFYYMKLWRRSYWIRLGWGKIGVWLNIILDDLFGCVTKNTVHLLLLLSPGV